MAAPNKDSALADDPVVLELIAQIEQMVGPLRPLQKAIAIAAIIDRVQIRGGVASSPGVNPLDLIRLRDADVKEGLVEEVAALATNKAVLQQAATNLMYGKRPTTPLPPTAGAGARAADQHPDLDPTDLLSIPENYAAQLTGKKDALLRPLLNAYDAFGNQLVWDENFKRTDLANFGSTGQEDGPLPLGAEHFGITEPGQGIPQNLFELDEAEARIASMVGQFITDDSSPERQGELRAAALGFGTGTSYFAVGAGVTIPSVQYATPIYMPGEQWVNFGSKSPGYKTEVQNALNAAGYLSDDNVVPGAWHGAAARAMEYAMIDANGSGVSWMQQVESMASGRAAQPKTGSGRGSRLSGRVLTLPAYVEPDLAQLETEVQDSFERQLRRKPLDWEMALLADHLNSNYREQYDSQTQALKQEFEAGNKGLLAGGPAVVSGGTVEGVNPQARLIQQIQDRYAAELEFNDDRVEDRQNVANVFSVLTQTQQTLSGGAQ